MKLNLQVIVDGDFAKWSAQEYLRVEKAVTRGITDATASLKAAWRADVTTTLGARLGGTIRSKVYPSGQPSANAAGIVWSKFPEIVGAHERGAIIRAANGFWLAIPLSAAGRTRRGSRMTPAKWQTMTGRELRFVPTGRGRAVLVADNSRVNIKGRAITDRRRGKLQARRATTAVPIFALVPQVKLPKRLNLRELAQQVGATLPARIAGNWGN